MADPTSISVQAASLVRSRFDRHDRLRCRPGSAFANRFAAALSFVDQAPLVSLTMKPLRWNHYRWATPKAPGYLTRKWQKNGVRRLTDKVWSPMESVGAPTPPQMTKRSMSKSGPDRDVPENCRRGKSAFVDPSSEFLRAGSPQVSGKRMGRCGMGVGSHPPRSWTILPSTQHEMRPGRHSIAYR